MLYPTDYAKNYAGIMGAGLPVTWLTLCIELRQQIQPTVHN